MGCGTGILKCLLIFFNVILGIIGLILLAVGIFIKVGAQKMIDQFAGGAIQGLLTLPGQYYTDSGNTTQSTPPSLDLAVILTPVSTVLIVFGAIIAVVSFLGAFGTCCGSKCLLATYTTAVLIIVLVEIILAAVILTGSVDDKIKDPLKQTIVDNYYDIDHFDMYSLGWNFVMLQFNCCGLIDYTDFNNAVHWTRTKTVSSNGYSHTVNLTTPVACCKLSGNFPNVKITNDQCAITPTDAISNWHNGCWNGVTTFLGQYRPIIVGIVCGIIIFEFLLAVIAIVIICSYNNDTKVSP